MLAWVVIYRRHFTQTGLRKGLRQSPQSRSPKALPAIGDSGRAEKGAIRLSRSHRCFPSFSLPPYIITSLLPYFALSPLAATLMGLPASVANKRLTFRLNPLDATLTKNRGAHPSSQTLFSVLAPSPVPYPLLPYSLSPFNSPP